MRVICIDDGPGFGVTEVRPTFKYGNVLIVELWDVHCKILGHERYWHHSRFVRCSNISETEFIREYKKEFA